MNRSYQQYKQIFKSQQFPLAFVDLDLLDNNINTILERTHRGNIRIASKSVRSVEILQYLFSKSDRFKGIMSFTANESLMLVDKGFDDILLGYPCVDKPLINQIASKISEGKTIVLMVDLVEHVQLINQIGKENNVQIPICIDLDCSSDFGPIHFGVWRSSITNNQTLQVLLDEIKKSDYVKLDGLMGYEAQIAGLGDAIKGDGVKNSIVRFLKKKSIKEIKKRRGAAIQLIKDNGFQLRFINGGGTGSIKETLEEEYITEVTVGSGFYNPTLFDNYSTFSFQPAAGFAVQIVRNPKENYFTCHGGGYIASGEIGHLKEPKIYLPKEAKLDKNEGCGEVQTPVIYKGKEELKVGDPIFFRHAKAGELCERFNYLHLIRNNSIQKTITTYRGDGYSFL
jgi:D-serine deaminase-like pyridoxal phosphate-dependent protein